MQVDREEPCGYYWKNISIDNIQHLETFSDLLIEEKLAPFKEHRGLLVSKDDKSINIEIDGGDVVNIIIENIKEVSALARLEE